MSEHSSFISGSTAGRRMSCPASGVLEKGVPNTTSPYAAEGTMLHSVMAKVLEEGVEPEELLGYSEGGHTFTKQLLGEMVKPALNHFDALQEKYGEFQYVVEKRLHFSYQPEAFGWADVLAFSDTHTVLIDWKFGRGVPVQGGVDNIAGMFYLAAARSMPEYGQFFNRDTLAIVIIQPAMSPGLSDGAFTMAHLDTFERHLGDTFNLLEEGVMRFERSESGCRFCRAKPICPLWLADFIRIEETAGKNDFIESSELARLLNKAEEAESWAKSVFALGNGELARGREVPGWALIPKRAVRKWVDEAKTDAYCRKIGLNRDEYETSKLKSPAQLETVIKAKELECDLSPLIVSQSSGVNMTRVPIDDPVSNTKDEGLNLPPRKAQDAESKTS